MPTRATSDLEVAQRAMILAGIEPMDSWEDPDPQTRTVKAFYEDLITSELSGNSWKFNTTDIVLNRLLDSPLYGFSAAYEIPLDPPCLSVKSILVAGSPARWRVSQRQVYVDANATDEVILTGQFREPVLIWPPWFTIFVEARVAAWASASITRNGSLGQFWSTEAMALLVKGRSRDAMQQTGDRLPIGRFTAVRRGARN